MDLAAEGNQVQNNVPAENQSNVQDAQQEKVLKQSEVNELVGRVKHEAYTKGMRDAQQSPQQSQQPQGNGSGMGGMQQLTEEQVRQLIADEAQKQNSISAAQNMLQNFVQQMGNGKGNYSDFDETVASLGDLKNIPHVIQLATDTGMAGDVMYELGRNPGKVATLTTLSYVNPNLAKLEMQKLADSIKKNQAATSNVPNVDEPLSQVKPSTVSTDSGTNSVRDLRRKPWARV